MNTDVPVKPDKSGMDAGDISRLVDAFYRRVRQDARLGPIFEHRIGHTDAEWQPHLAKIEGFWANVMLGARSYRGNPMQAHLAVPDIRASDFGIWLDLFEGTARDLLPENKAEAFVVIARRIGASLSMGLQRVQKDGIPDLRG